MKIKILILLCSMFISGQSFADDLYPWFASLVKQVNPDQLYYFVVVTEECELDRKELLGLVEGVFIRSRIKPIEWTGKNLFLSVGLQCTRLKNQHPIYRYDIAFAKYPNTFMKDYGGFGIGPKERHKEGIKRGVEEALADYIKANFDL
jgi:hypothetical protein